MSQAFCTAPRASTGILKWLTAGAACKCTRKQEEHRLGTGSVHRQKKGAWLPQPTHDITNYRTRPASTGTRQLAQLTSVEFRYSCMSTNTEGAHEG